MKKLMLAAILFATSLSAAQFERIYVDRKEVNSSQDCFRIHQGDNVWIECTKLNRDATGFYIYEDSITRFDHLIRSEYKKSWKCPYCYRYWDEGKPCGYAQCPGKNK